MELFSYFTIVTVLTVIILQTRTTLGGTFTVQSEKALPVRGMAIYYCEWKGEKHLPGAEFRDYTSCVQCRCGRQSMTCSSLLPLVFISDTVKAQTDCTQVIKNCEPRWVLKDDMNTECPVFKIPEHSAII